MTTRVCRSPLLNGRQRTGGMCRTYGSWIIQGNLYPGPRPGLAVCRAYGAGARRVMGKWERWRRMGCDAVWKPRFRRLLRSKSAQTGVSVPLKARSEDFKFRISDFKYGKGKRVALAKSVGRRTVRRMPFVPQDQPALQGNDVAGCGKN